MVDAVRAAGIVVTLDEVIVEMIVPGDRHPDVMGAKQRQIQPPERLRLWFDERAAMGSAGQRRMMK